MEFLAHLRKSRCQALRQRAEILLASMVYTPVYQIALIFRTDEAYVRKVIHAFNEFGFESLNPKIGTGRPRTFEPAIRERIVAIALAPPTTVGEPLTHWSLRRLKGHLERRKIVPSISIETLRCMLRERNVTFQRTRPWKRSTDAAFEQKATRIMALHRICPADGVVVCFDEFGPISLQPYPGHCYAQRKRPWRRRATYVRRGGVGYSSVAMTFTLMCFSAATAWPRARPRCWPSTGTSAGAIPNGCASTSSMTTCRSTGHLKSASGPKRTTWNWCRRRPRRVISITSSATSDRYANSC